MKSQTEPRDTPDSNKPLTPHRVLGEYYPDEASRREFLGDIFDRSAPAYDLTEKLIGFGSGPWYRHQALLRAGLKKGMRVIDVGVGTGLVANEAIKIVGDPALVTGVDPSAGMMAQATLPPQVKLLKGTGEAIPCEDQSGDFVSMGFALRHLSAMNTAFQEYFRVLSPGGRVCLLEITPPENALYRGALKIYMKYIIPNLTRLWSRDPKTHEVWRYYWETTEACVSPEVVMQALSDAGFESIERHVELGMFSEYRAVKPAN